jgi:hypothetical protein
MVESDAATHSCRSFLMLVNLHSFLGCSDSHVRKSNYETQHNQPVWKHLKEHAMRNVPVTHDANKLRENEG